MSHPLVYKTKKLYQHGAKKKKVKITFYLLLIGGFLTSAKSSWLPLMRDRAGERKTRRKSPKVITLLPHRAVQG